MRFHKRSTTPSYFSRRDQIRLFRLVAALGVIFLAMLYASREENWYWLTGRPAGDPARQQAKEAPREIDFNVREEPKLNPDEFRSEPAPEIKVPEQVISQLESGEFDVRIDPRLLNPVSDSTLGIKSHEANALYYLLAKAAAIPQNVLEQSAEPAPPFVVVMTESPKYRGTLMKVKGQLKRLKALPVEENKYGVQSIYEGWFFSKDSGTHPWRVICTQLPPGIPMGDNLSDMPEVQITGYYFKKYGYASAAGKLQTAPLLIARQIRWFPQTKQTAPSSSGAVKYIVSLFLVISIALAFLIWKFMVSDQNFSRSRTAKLMQRPDMSMESLNDIETVDINDVLKQMGQQKQNPPGSDQSDQQK
ncbi:hypothetical protein [Gimesia algae]|uniref:Uncharacterized protein n=1 Tax=Gimesia algae TaxID=2527971 RepID=A0A517VGB8_9PLAN|nr:hypothetical protein [Gimesia algae]QDT92052.1 hypothetical protein Pan161_37160 [Gimesia algae]